MSNAKNTKSIVRTAEVKLDGTRSKTELLRYAHSRYRLYTAHFVAQLFYKTFVKSLSTAGMGWLANKAQQKALAIRDGAWASHEATGNKISKPATDRVQMLIDIEANNKGDDKSSFDYWISISNPFGGNKKVCVPAHATKHIKNLGKRGFRLSGTGEVFWRGDSAYCRVFFRKEVKKRPGLSLGNIGIDVGFASCVATSAGRLGRSLRDVARRATQKNASRQRQGAKKKSGKTFIKQILDREAKLVVSVARRKGVKTLVLENQAVIANLRGRGTLGRWARSHFSERVKQLAAEHELCVLEVNPRNTSRECSYCGFIHKKNRNGKVFLCRRCGFGHDADLNAALNISGRGRALAMKFIAKSGARKRNTKSRAATKVAV